MAKLTKQESKLHQQAEALLSKDILSIDDKEFILTHWHPAAAFDVGASGAFFTPFELAKDFRIDAGTGRIIDLCAGIGSLAYWCRNFTWGSEVPAELVCVEINPAYVEIGKKILPEATWICANVFDVPDMDLGYFDHAIANPPFGKVNRHGRTAPRYEGSDFAYHVIDIASDLADHGAFILPQGSAPFRYSGVQYYQRDERRSYQTFLEQTAIELDAGCGIDCSIFQNQWKGTSPAVEIVCADFTNLEEQRRSDQGDLFAITSDQSEHSHTTIQL